MVDTSDPPSNAATETNSDTEKDIAVTTKETDDHNRFIEEAGFHGAHILDANQLRDPNLKTTADGKTILIPQPSTDPHDPLNWSFLKKHIILAVITVATFVPDFGSSMGVITLLPQSKCVASLPPFNHTHVAHCALYLRLRLITCDH